MPNLDRAQRWPQFTEFLWNNIGRDIDAVVVLDPGSIPIPLVGRVTCHATGAVTIGTRFLSAEDVARMEPLRWRVHADIVRGERARVLPEDVPDDLVYTILHDYRAASEVQVRGILAALWSIHRPPPEALVSAEVGPPPIIPLDQQEFHVGRHRVYYDPEDWDRDRLGWNVVTDRDSTACRYATAEEALAAAAGFERAAINADLAALGAF